MCSSFSNALSTVVELVFKPVVVLGLPLMSRTFGIGCLGNNQDRELKLRVRQHLFRSRSTVRMDKREMVDCG